MASGMPSATGETHVENESQSTHVYRKSKSAFAVGNRASCCGGPMRRTGSGGIGFVVTTGTLVVIAVVVLGLAALVAWMLLRS